MRRLIRYLPIKKPWPDPRYFYCGPTFSQAKGTAWQRLIDLCPPEWIADISLSNLTIKTVFGSELFVMGLDKPQRIEGRILDGGIVDECSDIKPGAFDLSIGPTLTTRKGWCWLIGIPKRFGVGAREYREKYEKAVSGELVDSAGFNWPSSTVLPEEELEIHRQNMDERDFDEQFNAKWINASGGIFHSFDKEFNVRPCTYDPGLSMVVCQDFNVNPMAWLCGHLHGNVFEVFDEVWIRNTNTPEALKVLLGRYGDHRGGFQMYGDASSRGRRTSAEFTDYIHIVGNELLKTMGRTMHYDRSNPSVADRFATTNARICNGAGQRQVFVDSKCKHLIYDLETRTYKPGTREADDSDKDQGHPTDALGYFLHKRFPLNLSIVNPQTIHIINRSK